MFIIYYFFRRIMAAPKTRSTRKLRSWIVEQVACACVCVCARARHEMEDCLLKVLSP